MEQFQVGNSGVSSRRQITRIFDDSTLILPKMSHTRAKNGYFGEKVVCKDRLIAREPKEIRKIAFALCENHKMKEHKIFFQMSVNHFFLLFVFDCQTRQNLCFFEEITVNQIFTISQVTDGAIKNLMQFLKSWENLLSDTCPNFFPHL